MINEEVEKLIEAMTKVRPEMLNEEATKLFNTIMEILDERDTLITERDYYKQRYLEVNNAFIEGGKKLTMNTEAMLKDLEKRYEVYRDNTCLHCGEGKPDYCEKCMQELITENIKLQRK